MQDVGDEEHMPYVQWCAAESANDSNCSAEIHTQRELCGCVGGCGYVCVGERSELK